MGKTIPTGNELFDLFWQAYPFRNTKKIGKKKCLAKFKAKKYDAETVQLMIDWIERDIENRATTRSKKQFYADPCDPIVFLNNDRWEDPIGVVISKTVHREAHRSKAVYRNNVREKIMYWSDVILIRTDAELRANKQFISAYDTYPEFRVWVKGQRTGLKKKTTALPAWNSRPMSGVWLGKANP